MSNVIIKANSDEIDNLVFEDFPQEDIHIIKARKASEQLAQLNEPPQVNSNLIREHQAQLDAVDALLEDLDGAPQGAGANRKPYDHFFPGGERLTPEKREAMREEWEEGWQEKLEQEKEAARQEGYQAGQDALRESIEAAYAARQAALVQDLSKLYTLWDRFLDRAEPYLIELSFTMVDAIQSMPLPDEIRAIGKTSLINALDRLKQDAAIRITLNPIDFLRLQENGITETLQLEFPHLSWDAQPDVAAGDWVMVSPQKVIRRVSDELIAAWRDTFGLRQDLIAPDIQLPSLPAGPLDQAESTSKEVEDQSATLPPPPSPFPDASSGASPDPDVDMDGEELT